MSRLVQGLVGIALGVVFRLLIRPASEPLGRHIGCFHDELANGNATGCAIVSALRVERHIGYSVPADYVRHAGDEDFWHPPRSSGDDIRPSIMSWSRGKWRSIKCGGNLSDGIVAPPRVGHSQAVAIDPSKDALSYLTICVVTDGTQGLDCLV
jgi:hypothetical protein